MKTTWRNGHGVELLENGEGFYPPVFEAIRNARSEVIIETFILFEDAVGAQLRDAMLAARANGASVEITIDGYGSPEFSVEYLETLRAAGVCIRVFDPRPRLFGMRTHIFRRLHRKIVVVDGCVAFVGGINFSADHLGSFGDDAKQDYSVRIEGPIVHDIRRAARALIDPAPRRWPHGGRKNMRHTPVQPAICGRARAAFVVRDNGEHRDDIEWHYRAAIRAARKRIVIANAYFVPGYRIMKGLRDAARRGVEVTLILQGHPDMPWVTAATRSLYRYLLPAGVRVVEYCKRPFHGKVALVDDTWATVGSSNLDPLSLAMNLEANVLVQDADFNNDLNERLQRLADQHCTAVTPEKIPGSWYSPVLGVVLYHLLRHFPRVAGWLPAHAPSVPEVVLGARDTAVPAAAERHVAVTRELPAVPPADIGVPPTLEQISSYRATLPAEERRRA